MKCPVCSCKNLSPILDINIPEFDQSHIYSRLLVTECADCTHQFNYLDEKDVLSLEQYYTDYYEIMGSVPAAGSIPGVLNDVSLENYNIIFSRISEYITKDSRVLDIGCSRGGFLLFLKDKGFSNLCGIDFIVPENTGIDMRQGSISSIPHDSDSFDLVILNHVLEHVHDLKAGMKDISRVLKPGGYLCVIVPDSSLYKITEVISNFWYLIKEHIHHFNLSSLPNLGIISGFTHVDIHRYTTRFMTGSDVMGNLLVVFKIDSIAKKIGNRKTYFWGISKEFFYRNALGDFPDILSDNIILVDGNTFKQKNYTFLGKSIGSPMDIDWNDSNSVIVVAAASHRENIMNIIRSHSYAGEVIVI